MRVRIVCIGKLKEKYWTAAVDEYSKRLSKYCDLEILQLKETKLADKPSEADEKNVIYEEGQTILKNIKDGTYVIALEINGKSLSSEELAAKVDRLAIEGKSDITFVIGGSLGLSKEVSQRADFSLSFSKMTFPHQMMRVILLEQIYRSFKIIKNEAYHK
ncbi:MAG: 23S rRNA (pseudouridine(1915)-N(3))-methyltransferase RlmH [Firmicutes bacterium]|jgi:23S rRNA (pseudouridine1915-N3)-methyltransferase|nr:23S rRNA (pseudouridine(1915)-N(3))-methyltransferase RlmH [Bacillota bacterium]